jgi:hypothetical protein
MMIYPISIEPTQVENACPEAHGFGKGHRAQVTSPNWAIRDLGNTERENIKLKIKSNNAQLKFDKFPTLSSYNSLCRSFFKHASDINN